ncbi:unnamed protein product [Clonostachys solani]|uniref:Epoxide hydrolase N-terminal domain-containing protein n=1 Tax=Clonostachys solani TaxID=160281 RepID=A0A9P0EMP2_9HYPO|nr:unnamed protein product [Clonostachys solani]
MARPLPFKIAVSDDQLNWIADRVRTTRLPPARNLPTDELWKSWGLPVSYAQELKDYWINEYDWRRVEKQLNSDLNQFTIPIDHKGEDLSIHFLHHRSDQPGAIPLIIAHGWPGSFLEIKPIIQHLTNPPSPNDQAYHVVIPSLPGFGFSSYPSNPCSPIDMADIFCKLMIALGYNHFMAQAGDWGAQVLRILATRYPDNCLALHLNFVITGPPSALWRPVAFARLVIGYLTGGWGFDPYEKRMFNRMKWWLDWENAYNVIQGTKPLTLSYGLTDSPFGMLCWIREKLNYLVGDDFEWTKEDTITWAMPYILNGSSGHAEIYKWAQRGSEYSLAEAFSKPVPSQIPFGASIFPNDVMFIPRWWAEGTLSSNIVFWKQHDSGGHFPCLEKPVELAADLREFTKCIDGKIIRSLKEDQPTTD